MKVTNEIIEYIASLARLNLAESEKTRLVCEMKDIISYMDSLNELDTSNIAPMEQVTPVNNVFREDKTRKSYSREKILYNAPSQEDGCFKVPKVIE